MQASKSTETWKIPGTPEIWLLFGVLFALPLALGWGEWLLSIDFLVRIGQATIVVFCSVFYTALVLDEAQPETGWSTDRGTPLLRATFFGYLLIFLALASYAMVIERSAINSARHLSSVIDWTGTRMFWGLVPVASIMVFLVTLAAERQGSRILSTPLGSHFRLPSWQ